MNLLNKVFVFIDLKFMCCFLTLFITMNKNTVAQINNTALVKNRMLATSNQSATISRLEDCKIPQQMISSIKSMGPKEMAVLREEFQQISVENGEEMVTTIKLRFINDSIYGYIQQAPVNNSSQSLVSNTIIRIPVIWCCSKQPQHEEHCSSLKTIKSYEDNIKCIGWKQKKDEETLAEDFGKPAEEQLIQKKKKKRWFQRKKQRPNKAFGNDTPEVEVREQ